MGVDDHKNLRDQWLDAALKKYGEAEPRAGIEGRVLANLRAERERGVQGQNPWPVWVGVVAMLSVGVLIFWVSGHRASNKAPAVAQTAATGRPQSLLAGDRTPAAILSKVQVLRRRGAQSGRIRTVHAAEPRLEQFPAARPLSQQEQMLADYVAQFPQEAVQMAQRQAELKKRDELEMQAGLPGNAGAQTSE